MDGADRIGIVEHGRLCFLGTVSELREQLAAHHSSLEHLFLELTQANGRPKEAEPIEEKPAGEPERAGP